MPTSTGVQSDAEKQNDPSAATNLPSASSNTGAVISKERLASFLAKKKELNQGDKSKDTNPSKGRSSGAGTGVKEV